MEQAIELAAPGDVLVVDGGGRDDVILMGGLMSTRLMARGVAYTRLVDLQIDTMTTLGVPRDRIEVLDAAGSTAEEAQHVLRLATAQKFARLIIVTSKQHTRRARLVMNRRLRPAGVTVIVRASRYDRSNIPRWWTERGTLRFTLFETQRLLGYWIGVAD